MRRPLGHDRALPGAGAGRTALQRGALPRPDARAPGALRPGNAVRPVHGDRGGGPPRAHRRVPRRAAPAAATPRRRPSAATPRSRTTCASSPAARPWKRKRAFASGARAGSRTSWGSARARSPSRPSSASARRAQIPTGAPPARRSGAACTSSRASSCALTTRFPSGPAAFGGARERDGTSSAAWRAPRPRRRRRCPSRRGASRCCWRSPGTLSGCSAPGGIPAGPRRSARIGRGKPVAVINAGLAGRRWVS